MSLNEFCDTKYIIPSAMFFIKEPSGNPNLPESLIRDNDSSVAFAVTNDQDFAALSEINLYLLPSLIQ
jgi:hypothetical protein